jgi:hypothetical protein
MVKTREARMKAIQVTFCTAVLCGGISSPRKSGGGGLELRTRISHSNMMASIVRPELHAKFIGGAALSGCEG